MLQTSYDMAWHVAMTMQELEGDGCTEVQFLGWYKMANGHWKAVILWIEPDGLTIKST